jgi:hypothetical protein
MSILFPAYDAITVEQTRRTNSEEEIGDFSIENIQYEIEECKYQTTLVQEQTTAKGNKTWDLPKIKGVITEGIKNRLRKDHFTSLLLANDAARSLNVREPDARTTFGGYSSKEAAANKMFGGNMYQGRGLKKMKNISSNINRPSSRSRPDGSNGSIAY